MWNNMPNNIDRSAETGRAIQLQKQSELLDNVIGNLFNYRSGLNDNWKATEMMYIDRAIQNVIDDIGVVQTELRAIGEDLVLAANLAWRAKELENARETLRMAENQLRHAENHHRLSPSALTQRLLDDARNHRNTAANRVKELSR